MADLLADSLLGSVQWPNADWRPAPGTRLYLAGKMSGVPDHNFPAFREAARHLREMGYDVTSPAEMDESEDHAELARHPWADYLRRDLRALSRCDAITVLYGWQESRGASLEVQVARALGMPVLYAETATPYWESVLHEADRLVHGARGEMYGHPADNFGRIGRMWGATLDEWRQGVAQDVPACLVAMCMVQVKIDREAHCPNRDNRTDGAGYFEADDMAHERGA